MLHDLLASLGSLRVPRGLVWEILIVDNGSNNLTPELVRSLMLRLPIRCVHESKPGSSHARNRAVLEARGGYICWTDDDVIVDADWLSGFVAAFTGHPSASFFGGEILPVSEGRLPGWFSANVHRWPISNIVAYTAIEEAERRIVLGDRRLPREADYATRRLEQTQHAYDPELGLSPTKRRSGEERDVIFRIIRNGGLGWWNPSSKVTHRISAERATLAFPDRY